MFFNVTIMYCMSLSVDVTLFLLFLVIAFTIFVEIICEIDGKPLNNAEFAWFAIKFCDQSTKNQIKLRTYFKTIQSNSVALFAPKTFP